MQHARIGVVLAKAACVLGLAGVALADGMIVPVHDHIPVRGHWAVKYHRVSITVRNQVADVSIDQAFVNLGRAPLEVEYVFPVPPGAGIDKLTLLADGKELQGKLLAAEDARRIYEDIVRRKKDPALLEYVGYGLYKTSVFPIPPGGERRVQVHYTAECRRQGDLVTVHYPLNTEKFSAQAIEDVRVTVDIQGRGQIGPVYSPTHELKVTRPAGDRVTAEYHVTNAVPTTDFELIYQDQARRLGATVLSHRPNKDQDGYFMILVSPPTAAAGKPIAKDIVLVIDRSGSMGGKKIKQARQSLRWILQNLNPEDRFNVVSFSDSIEVLFNVGLVDADEQHVAKAVDMVAGLSAGGATNIAGALTTALKLLPADETRPAYVIFLTDGKPTVAPKDDKEILKQVTEANVRRARLFSLGVGYDVNVRLVDLLAQRHRGASEYVKENESLEGKVSALYAKVRNPMMTDVTVELAGAAPKYVYPDPIGDLFDGRQLVLVGRYARGGSHTLTIRGDCQGKPAEHTYDVTLDTFSEDNSQAYLERVWATRRLGFLMDQIALDGQDKEIIDEIVKLSRDYGIMTPYTSFLAEEDTHLGDALELRKSASADVNLGALRVKAGEAGQRQAVARQELRLGSVAAAPAARPMSPASGPDAKDRAGSYGGTMVGNTSREEYEAGRVESVANLRQVNRSTLYRRGNQWFTPDLADAVEKGDLSQAAVIRQFSDEWFDLSRANTREQNELLASQQPGEELIVNLRGQTYRILSAEQGH